MKPLASIFLAAALVLPTAGCAGTVQQPVAQEQKGRVIAESEVANDAVVKAIDLNKRRVTVTTSGGKERTFVVDPSVQKLDQVKVGDVIKVRYQEAISVRLNKTKVPPTMSVQESFQRNEESAKPAGVSKRVVTATATIEKVSDDGKKVTLTLPDGGSMDVLVRDPQSLEKLKKGEVKEGDQIEITYTEAVALSVEKAADK